MNWDVMNGLAGFPAGALVVLGGFGIIMAIGLWLTRGTGRHGD
jgi:hypothetical protein